MFSDDEENYDSEETISIESLGLWGVFPLLTLSYA
jgi:hypothetical protein